MPTLNLVRFPWRFVLGCALTTALVPSSRAQGTPAKPLPTLKGQISAATPPGTPKPAATEPAQGNAVHQGLTMHGHWTIDVKNPDGTVAAHSDFENSITAFGAAYLVNLLAGYSVPSDYAIYLDTTGNASGSPCIFSSIGGVNYGCMIVRSIATNPGYIVCANYQCSANLTYGYNTNLTTLASNTMVLTGSITASQAGTVSRVTTFAGSCPGSASPPAVLNTTSPSTCTSSNGGSGYGYAALTSAAITGIPVASGQIIQVTVTLSFS